MLGPTRNFEQKVVVQRVVIANLHKGYLSGGTSDRLRVDNPGLLGWRKYSVDMQEYGFAVHYMVNDSIPFDKKYTDVKIVEYGRR